MPINKELFKGCSKTVVLRLLSQKKMHGYELSKKLEESFDGQIKITEGTLYPLLHALETDGAITADWEKSEGKRKKKVYRISPKGKKVLKEKLAEWQEFVNTMQVLLPTQCSVFAK